MKVKKNPFFLGKKYEKNTQKNTYISSEMTRWQMFKKVMGKTVYSNVKKSSIINRDFGRKYG